MATLVYNAGKRRIADGTIDLDTDSLKVMLVTSAYTPDIDTHLFRSSVTNEVVGAGYTAGGQAMANVAVAQDDTNDRATVDADDNVWPASTITARGAVIYKDTGNPATDNLIGYLDFGSDIVSTAGNFTIAWDAVGFMTLT